ncbi:protein-S-isoprenylcysteine O-methyltransferase [Skeletonema marinoi]|uniref:Protein-S-isoprenylcysteine O-methyltransferase n=1 Tax=Skeletonema marinoi TaxID=267567 RepID=A0AAD8Y2T6_9STRA|nr:protein-S-isoprenylcysteine O-methyltransferase [Skeletonema marinoi]
MKGFPIPLILAFTSSATRRASAFVPQPLALNNGRNYQVSTNKLLATEKKDDVSNNILSSLQLPSPEAVKENILEGNVGERGETYVVAQFSLLFFIAIGVGDVVTTILGPVFIIAGLILVYKSAADLKDNLSPWPVATDPKAGRGSLINEGIYSYIRHPMYAGLLLGMTGLSILTDSITRLLLTFALYLVLDAKSDFEEASLVKTYGSDYGEYKAKVKSKFFPLDVNSVFTNR